ncbi:hypothetical protein PS3A_15930 [Pseudomonas sp. 3A(2025)]
MCDQPEEQTEEELENCINDLFLRREYLGWRRGLKSFSQGRWHRLIECLAKSKVPSDEFLAFGPDIYSKLVFSYIEAPDYEESRMLMVQFTVSGSMWHWLVWHCPERN